MPTRPNRVKQLRTELGVGHQLSLLPTMLGSMLTKDFVAIHMAWGAINELTTLTGYYQLIRRSEHPVLHQMLRRVIQDERRHFAFYRAQARARLANAPRRSKRFVRWVFQNVWTPVGAGVKTQEEVDALALYLFGDAPRGPAGDPRAGRDDLGDPRSRGSAPARGTRSTRRSPARLSRSRRARPPCSSGCDPAGSRPRIRSRIQCDGPITHAWRTRS